MNNRSKNYHFRSMWIDYNKRRPPSTEEPILAWNYKLKRATVTNGAILNLQQDQVETKKIILKDLDPAMFHTGYFINKWMRIYPPED